MSAYPFVSSFSAGVAGQDRPFAAAQGSFVSLDCPDLQVVTLKEAEDGRGYILRLRETNGRAGTAELALAAMQLQGAYLCNGVEENARKLESTVRTVKLPYQANRFLTVRLNVERALPQAQAQR